MSTFCKKHSLLSFIRVGALPSFEDKLTLAFVVSYLCSLFVRSVPCLCDQCGTPEGDSSQHARRLYQAYLRDTHTQHV